MSNPSEDFLWPRAEVLRMRMATVDSYER
ncbi:hypothetical protein PSP6_270226 [Paraburkholderia tropica]|nr:hypothetical protein PSP6_270226 [Paraburkholderia tropica]